MAVVPRLGLARGRAAAALPLSAGVSPLALSLPPSPCVGLDGPSLDA